MARGRSGLVLALGRGVGLGVGLGLCEGLVPGLDLEVVVGLGVRIG